MPRIYFTPEELPYKPLPRYDLTGKQFGRLTVLRVVGRYQAPNNSRLSVLLWECKCSCGNLPHVQSNSLKAKRSPTRSCGCLTVATHGLSGIPEYKVWGAMIQRCFNPNHVSFKDWGGRGITVCDRWRHSFENFIADMGRRPSGARYSIERINNDGNYEPSNCKWETNKNQMANMRKNRILTVNGVSRTMAQWADITGLKHITIYSRKSHGWSDEQAISPLRFIRSRRCSA